MHIRCISCKGVCSEYLYGKFHFLTDFHYYLKKCFDQKKISLNTANHILKSVQLLLVCSLSTFNSLLQGELIKWTIDPYNLCTFIKGTPALQYIQLTMPVSLEFPTGWMGLKYMSTRAQPLLEDFGRMLSWKLNVNVFFRLNKSTDLCCFLFFGWFVPPSASFPSPSHTEAPFSPVLC